MLATMETIITIHIIVLEAWLSRIIYPPIINKTKNIVIPDSNEIEWEMNLIPTNNSNSPNAISKIAKTIRYLFMKGQILLLVKIGQLCLVSKETWWLWFSSSENWIILSFSWLHLRVNSTYVSSSPDN